MKKYIPILVMPPALYVRARNLLTFVEFESIT